MSELHSTPAPRSKLMPEDPLSEAERHTSQAQRLIAKQERLIARMNEHRDPPWMQNMGQRVLAALRHTLQVARQHVRLERKKRGLPS
jgi:hypothetical protein